MDILKSFEGIENSQIHFYASLTSEQRSPSILS